MSSTEVVSVATNTGLREQVASMAEGKVSVYSTIEGKDFASRKATVQAIANSTPLRDSLGQVIRLTNFVVQVVPMENEQTKQMEDAPRVILIDDEGNSFHAISSVILNDLNNITGIMGQPSTWDEPIEVAVSEQRSNNQRRFMTLNLV